MDYIPFYDYVIKEIAALKTSEISSDYRLCKALAACYELQEYLANKIAESGSDDIV